MHVVSMTLVVAVVAVVGVVALVGCDIIIVIIVFVWEGSVGAKRGCVVVVACVQEGEGGC